MNGPLDRREFLKASLVTAGSAAAALGAAGRLSADGSPGEWRNRQAGMKYRRLGRTGFMVSEIVQGGDPITPDNRRHVEVAVERGLNYLDTAPVYAGGKSEPGYAQVLRSVGRDRVFLTTKVSPLGGARNQAYQEIFAGLTRAEQESILKEVAADLRERDATLPSYMGNYFQGQLQEIETDALSDALERRYPGKIDARATYAETMVRSVEESLRRLKTDHVDILMCPHGASSYAETQIPEVHETFEKLRQEGKVRALGVSAHNDPAGVLRGAIASGVYSAAMVAYNLVNHAHVAPALEEAKKADFGVIAMKVAQAMFEPNRDATPRPERVALLERTVPDESLNVFQKAYRFGLSNPHLSAVISNMVDEKQVKENLAVIEGS
ncbi:MAG: aldo/keto reductase [Acidobacteria bacterium]|jgi:aryl-alcohol dehydrogenase-like predicted oxidoreductase|nr:aldo/keto reductase [Acidobacteriota bacterium]